jgi:2-polyprenyl-6-methoxyphenol hydroxylase-like FAD-dependent oxidoreductase
MTVLPVLTPKISVPPPRRGTVIRPRLHQRLRAARDATLTTVVAPAGWGKTTLLSSWANDPEERRPVGWLSIDEGDDEPFRFWTYVLSALHRVAPGIARHALTAVGAPVLDPINLAIAALLNALTGSADEYVLVLDDYHLLADALIHESIEFLLDYLPPTLHLVIAGRSDPVLPLARMRARGTLAEIRIGDLRCTVSEGSALLAGVTDVPDAAADGLVAKTEGWAAGLRLAADSAVAAEMIGRDARHVLDYFDAEVLKSLDPGQHDLLVRCSVLERLSGPLCDAVLGTTGSAAVLEGLDRADLFVTPLGGPWYRCHQLFRDALRRELDPAEPDTARHVLGRAAEWFLARGHFDEAIAHRIAAGDEAAASELIRENVGWFLDRGAMSLLMEWGERLAASDPDPRLYLVAAAAACHCGKLDRAALPLGAHARRANARDAVVLGQVRLHRMIRRGTSYGPPLPLDTVEDDGADRGIMFAFVGAHIGTAVRVRQDTMDQRRRLPRRTRRAGSPGRPARRRRPVHRPPRTDPTSSARPAAVRRQPGRRVLLHAGTARPALDRRSGQLARCTHERNEAARPDTGRGRRGRPGWSRLGLFADGPRRRRGHPRPGGRGCEHLPRGGRARPDARGARRHRRQPGAGPPGVGRPPLRDQGPGRGTVHRSVRRAAHPVPVHADGAAGRHRAVLGDRLETLGGGVHREHTVTGVAADDAGVTVAVRLPDDTPAQVRARYVVGCDGMHSTVRQQVGIGFAGSRYAESFALADVHMDWPLSREEVHLFFSPAGLVVVAPLPGDRYRIVATMDQAPEHPALADVQALLDARGPARERSTVRDVVWSSRFQVHHRLADTYRHGGVFLAGDAAHVHSPAGGQGMNTGIQDATTLAAILADVLDGSADAARLDAYEAMRRPVAQGVIATTHRLTRAATARNPLVRTLRNFGFRAAEHVPAVRRSFAGAARVSHRDGIGRASTGPPTPLRSAPTSRRWTGQEGRGRERWRRTVRP